MTTPSEANTIQGLVQDMRTIRDQISNEIKDMTFEQERAYLDNLLSDKPLFEDKPDTSKSQAY